MTNSFNKNFKKCLLSTTAIIGFLLSNPLNVSAEEPNNPDFLEHEIVEALQVESEKENHLVEDSVDVNAVDADDVEADDVEAEDVDAEDAEIDDVNAEDVEIDDVNAEDAEIDDVNAEDAEIDDVDAEDSETDNVEPETVDAETADLTAEDIDKVDVDSEEDEETKTTEEENQQVATASAFNTQVFSALTSNLSTTRSAKVNASPVERISGATRDHIAATISKRGWTSSNVVFLANGFKEADVLTGSPLARAHDAPILFTRTDNLPTVTLNEIQRLGASKVYILGGNKSVTDRIANTLANNNLSVERIDGRTRYHLASNIASRVMEIEGENRDAYLVNGEAYADAISIAPVAANKRLPIFLTQANVLHNEVKKALPAVHSWDIIGGLKSIPNSIVSEMESAGAEISNRFDGKNRYEVNRNVINYYSKKNQDYTYVASGEVVSDALATTPLAGKEGSSILLVRNNHVNNLHEQTEFIKEDKNIDKYLLVGGEKTLSKFTENHFVEPVVYLDPGHGSTDTGAYYGGVAERDINLPLSKKIQKSLNDYGYKVVMSRTTRNNQYYENSTSDLYARPEAANQIDADIFVSVHFDAMPGSSVAEGISVFTYSQSSKYPPLAKNEKSHNDPTRLRESERLASALQNELIDATSATNRGTQSGAFVVLREAKMPAVLLELGFMTNPAELARIQTDWYQERLTTGVVNGVNRYFMI